MINTILKSIQDNAVMNSLKKKKKNIYKALLEYNSRVRHYTDTKRQW